MLSSTNQKTHRSFGHKVASAEELGIKELAIDELSEIIKSSAVSNSLIRPDSSHFPLDLCRLVLPTKNFSPSRLITYPTNKIFEILFTDEFMDQVKKLGGENCTYVRRASINFMKKGDSIGFHRDTEQDKDLKVVTVFCLKKAAKGGDHILHRSHFNLPVSLNVGDVLFSDPDELHSVSKITEGERVTIVTWFSDYNGPIR